MNSIISFGVQIIKKNDQFQMTLDQMELRARTQADTRTETHHSNLINRVSRFHCEI